MSVSARADAPSSFSTNEDVLSWSTFGEHVVVRHTFGEHTGGMSNQHIRAMRKRNKDKLVADITLTLVAVRSALMNIVGQNEYFVPNQINH